MVALGVQHANLSIIYLEWSIEIVPARLKNLKPYLGFSFTLFPRALTSLSLLYLDRTSRFSAEATPMGVVSDLVLD